MKTIHYSTKAKKDLKKYRNNIRLMEALYEVLSSLIKGEAVPEKYTGTAWMQYQETASTPADWKRHLSPLPPSAVPLRIIYLPFVPP